MKVPLCKMDKDEEILKIFQKILESGYFVNGPHLTQFEQAIQQTYGVPHAVAVNSGTMGLFLLRKAYEFEPGDEIIVPSFTFFSTISPLLSMGIIPRFIDIDPATFCLGEKSLEKTITKKTKKNP